MNLTREKAIEVLEATREWEPDRPYFLRAEDWTELSPIQFEEAVLLISSGAAEAICTKKANRIIKIRLLFPEDQAKSMIANVKPGPVIERSGSIIGQASRTVYREDVGQGVRVWSPLFNRCFSFGLSHPIEAC